MKPIIFSTELIPKILDGTKTMTRRVIKPQPKYFPKMLYCQLPIEVKFREEAVKSCPYGQVGDRLWVRETFAKRPLPSGDEQILYKEQFNELVELLDLNTFAKDR